MAETSPSATTPPKLPPLPLERVNDFPDRLSPMLVKELRQGLRTSTFVILFLVLQGLLAIVLLITTPIAIAEGSVSGTIGEVVSKIVFCIYALGILVVQPLRGISAVTTEIRQNTIDLMVLTRLSAWRIVYGKWLSIVSQSALIALAILPYLILRYSFGGMQLFSELALMAYLFFISGTLTAFTVGLSATGSALLRGLVVVGGSAIMMGYIFFSLHRQIPEFVEILSFTRSDQSLTALAILAIAIYASYFFLEIGTTAIAPTSENRATRKRLIGLVIMAGSYLLLHAVDPALALITALIITGCISLDLFSERARFPSVICRRFLRMGPLGRASGRLLYPGWATGSLFFLTLGLVLFLLIFLTNPDPRSYTYAAIGLGTLAFPAALIQLFARDSSNRFSLYLTLLLLCFVLSAILSELYGVVPEKLLLWVFSFIPAVLLPVAGQSASSPDQSTVLLVSSIVTGIYLLIILGGSLPHVVGLSRLEAEALEDLDAQDLAEVSPDH